MVFAFATEHGGRTSHTAIIANAMELPAVVGLGHFLNDVASGDTVVVDGAEGVLIIDPDPAVEAQYRKARDTRLSRSGYWVVERHLPSVTLDGTTIEMLGNIEFPDEATACTARGAGGVGLYRTEFLYVGRDSDPTEEEHLRLPAVIREMGEDRPVVIRTLDLGRGQVRATHGPKGRRRTCRSGCAQCGSVCAIHRCFASSSGRSFGRAPSATCASCSP